jgi:hypothetical protein
MAREVRSLDPSGPNSVPGELPRPVLEVPRAPAADEGDPGCSTDELLARELTK